MDGFEFVASIVKSAAWPAVVMFGLYLFRKEIRPILSNVRTLRLKHKETSAEIWLAESTRTAKEIIEQSSAVPQLPASLPAPTKEEKQRFEQIVHVDPRAALLDSWPKVEEELNTLANTVANTLGINPNLRRSPMSQARSLRDQGVIDPRTMKLFEDLRSVRNRALLYDRSFFPSPDEAREFNRNAEVLAAWLAEQGRLWRERYKSG